MKSPININLNNDTEVFIVHNIADDIEDSMVIDRSHAVCISNTNTQSRLEHEDISSNQLCYSNEYSINIPQVREHLLDISNKLVRNGTLDSQAAATINTEIISKNFCDSIFITEPCFLKCMFFTVKRQINFPHSESIEDISKAIYKPIKESVTNIIKHLAIPMNNISSIDINICKTIISDTQNSHKMLCGYVLVPIKSHSGHLQIVGHFNTYNPDDDNPFIQEYLKPCDLDNDNQFVISCDLNDKPL